MLRSLFPRLNSRLLPLASLSRASAEQPVSSSFAACVSGSRHLSADPVFVEDYRAADAACVLRHLLSVCMAAPGAR